MSIRVPITPAIDDGMFIGTINIDDELTLAPEMLVPVYPLDSDWAQHNGGTWTASGNDKVIIDNTTAGNYYLDNIYTIAQSTINTVHFRLIASGEGITSHDGFSIKLILTDAGGLSGVHLGEELLRFPAGSFAEQQFSISVTPTAPAHYLYAYIFTRYKTGKITMWNAEIFQDGDTSKDNGWWYSAPIDLINEVDLPITTGEIALTNVAFKYGDIANVDDMDNVDYSIERLSEFDIIVTHEPDLLSVRELVVLNALLGADTEVYGYAQATPLDETEDQLTIIADAKLIMDRLDASGYTGVFFDMFGYDWGITRAQQNELIDYAKAKTPALKVFANAWVPADCLDDAVNATYNPTGVVTSLTTDDWVLLESFYVNESGYRSFPDSFNKYTETVSLASALGVKVCGLAYALPTTLLTDTTDWTIAYYLAVGLKMQGLSYSQDISSDNIDWPLSVFTIPKTGTSVTTPFAQINATTYEAVTSGGLLHFIAVDDAPASRSVKTLRITDSFVVDIQALPLYVAQQHEVSYFTSADGVTWTEVTDLTVTNKFFQVRVSIRGISSSDFKVVYSGLTDAETSSFEMGDKVFFLTGADFIYYDGITCGNVTDIAYVPTITLGRKTTGGGTPNERLNHLSNSWKDSFDPDGVAKTFPLSFSGLSAKPVTAILNGVDKVETTHFTVNRVTGVATWIDAPPSGTDTLTMQAERIGLMDHTVITRCNMNVEFGGKNNSLVFVAGNPSYPNVARHCWVYDPTYWPEDSDISIGNDSRFITGFGRMNDYLVTYKEPGDEFVQWYSSLDLDADGNISVSTNGLNDEFGCVAPRTVHPAQNGLLALSNRGVVWTWPSLVKGQANCKIVSRNVNGKNGIARGILDNTEADLSLAHAKVSGNKYLLHIKDKVWVLDLDYSDLANGTYCWYPYTGVYGRAGLFFARDNILHIGDNVEGIIYKESEIQFSDDDIAVDAWWTSPLMFLGGRNWIKKFGRIRLTFKVGSGNKHTLTFITDQGPEDIVINQEAGFFSASFFNAEFFNAGVLNPDYPSTQVEKIGYKGEYFQFKIRNNRINGLTMLAASIDYSLLKQIK